MDEKTPPPADRRLSHVLRVAQQRDWNYAAEHGLVVYTDSQCYFCKDRLNDGVMAGGPPTANWKYMKNVSFQENGKNLQHDVHMCCWEDHELEERVYYHKLGY